MVEEVVPYCCESWHLTAAVNSEADNLTATAKKAGTLPPPVNITADDSTIRIARVATGAGRVTESLEVLQDFFFGSGTRRANVFGNGQYHAWGQAFSEGG